MNVAELRDVLSWYPDEHTVMVIVRDRKGHAFAAGRASDTVGEGADFVSVEVTVPNPLTDAQATARRVASGEDGMGYA